MPRFSTIAVQLVFAAAAAGCVAHPRSAERLSVQWIGGPTSIVELGGFRILTDPVLGEGSEAFRIEVNPNTGEKNAAIARLSALPVFEQADLSLVLISHAHADHFDQRAKASLRRDLPLLLPREQLQIARDAGFTAAEGIAWWEQRTFVLPDGNVRITAVPAHHAHDASVAQFLGVGNGYWIERIAADGRRRTVYWTGDTVLTPDVASIPERLGRPELLLVHLGGVGAGGPLGTISLDAVSAVELVRLVAPRRVLPIHHSTFSLYAQPISRFELLLHAAALPSRLTLLAEGQRAEF